MGFGFSLSIITGQFEKDMADQYKPIAAAATGAMDDVATIVKAKGRSNIASAGFSKRWQNALRADRYPSRKATTSADAAVYVHHNIQYAGVFEDGARIEGKPLLWLPLSTTPKRVGGNLMTVARYTQSVGPLVSMGTHAGVPLMGAEVRVSRTQANKDRPKPTLAALKRGHDDGGKGVLRTIPLFFGIRVANIKKQFSIRQICADARDRIPALYAQHFNPEA